MARNSSVTDEIAGLRATLEESIGQADGTHAPAAQGAELRSELTGHLSDLAELAESLVEEAGASVAKHPVATLAATLLLGIVIGRLSAR